MTEPIEKRLYNADRAREVLDNESFQWAIEETKQEIVESWKNAGNPDDRERLWISLRLLNKLEASLKTRLETGKLARLELDHKKSLAERAKAWLE
mgnify:CR=1 FL=1